MEKVFVVVSREERGLGWNVIELEAPNGQAVVVEINDGGGFARTLAIWRLGPSRTVVAIKPAGES